MDRKPGSFVVDKGGKQRPNDKDEAMAERLGTGTGRTVPEKEVTDASEK